MQTKSSLRVSKSQRLSIFRSWLPDLLPPCRRCMPVLVACGCSNNSCSCELEIDVVDRDGEPCECVWPEAESLAYLALLGSVLARLDPVHYETPPTPSSPIATISAELRLAAMESRRANGQHLYHPLDRSADVGREGELIVMAGNGVKKRGGVGHVEESMHKGCYGGFRDKTAHRSWAPH